MTKMIALTLQRPSRSVHVSDAVILRNVGGNSITKTHGPRKWLSMYTMNNENRMVRGQRKNGLLRPAWSSQRLGKKGVNGLHYASEPIPALHGKWDCTRFPRDVRARQVKISCVPQ